MRDSEEGDNDNVFGLDVVWQRDIIAGQGRTNEIIDPVDWGVIDPKITALWGRVASGLGWPQTELRNGNNHSVVVRVDFGKASILLMGDLELAGIVSLLKLHRGKGVLDADVLQVGHYGSRNATTDALLLETTPKYAVIPMGPSTRQLPWTAWEYGHPRQHVVDLRADRVSGKRAEITQVQVATKQRKFVPIAVSKAIYATGWDGAVVLEADKEGVWKRFDNAPAPGRLDLNTATVAELLELPLIGHKRARAIVEHRAANGRFQSLEDLKQVLRIRQGTINALRHLVTVTP